MADVKLAGVKKSYGKIEVVHGVDIDVNDGEFVVFVGPSGCGKSTLLRMIAGLEEITAGDMYIGGNKVNDVAPADRGIAMVFQSYALYPHMSVYKNMAFGLSIGKIGKAEIDRRVRQAADILQLRDLLDRRPAQLSGGQRQRVAIGRAIVRDPQVFLFDEPLSNLDAALRVNTRLEIAKLHQDLKNTVIYVTHDQVEAMTLADKIVVMNEGNVEQIGSPLDLYHRPANLFVAGFIGSPQMNILPATVTSADEAGFGATFADGDTFSLARPAQGLAVNDDLSIGVRPEHLVAGSAGDLAISGTVDVVERLGDVSYIYLDLPDGGRVIVAEQGSADAAPGDQRSYSASSENVHVFGPEGRALR
jgi:multiple sugar transport system ATP-binding protein